MSKSEIEVHVVDLVVRLCLEAFVDKGELSRGQVQLHVVQDRAETRHIDEARARAVFVLEEGFDQ